MRVGRARREPERGGGLVGEEAGDVAAVRERGVGLAQHGQHRSGVARF
jgi:hypothetical protein